MHADERLAVFFAQTQGVVNFGCVSIINRKGQERSEIGIAGRNVWSVLGEIGRLGRSLYNLI